MATLNGKSGKAQYKKGQQIGEDRNNKRGEKDRKGEKSREDYWRNKENLMVRENNGFEASVYYHIISKY